MSKRKPPKQGVVKESSKTDSKKKTRKNSSVMSQRDLTISKTHVEAALEQYLHSMRLIDANEKIITWFPDITITVMKEVIH